MPAVQIPDEVRQSVVFLYSKHGDKMISRGTAFFVGVPSTSHAENSYVYLVAARHIVAGIQTHGDDGNVYARLNTVGGGFEMYAIPAENFIFHDDDSQCVDVAVCLGAPPQSIFEYKIIPRSMLVTDEIITQHRIGIGDETFTTGLFVNHSGRQRNIPIVRIGNISVMPDELVETELGMMEAYLVETRSVGGLSGSPVFVGLGPVRVAADGTTHLAQGQFFLLGLMHGHWQVPHSTEDDKSDLERELVNMGISIVIPSSKILDVIDSPLQVAFRDLTDLGQKK